MRQHSPRIPGNGDVYTWQPGQNEPQKVDGLANKGLKAIACGTYHFAVLTLDGQVYTWYGAHITQKEIENMG